MTATATAAAPTTPTLLEKFQAVEVSMGTRLIERQKEVRAAILATVGGLHIFLLGEPGTAKSALARQIIAHVDDLPAEAYFEHLLTKHTTPDELFGPPSLKSLKEDVYRRIIAGRLPVARIAFLDEIWKGSSAILNSLLSALNERIFYNDVPVHMNLQTVLCASNELPEGDELNAMYDRIHFRFQVNSIKDTSQFVRMLQAQGVLASDPTDKVTWADVEQATEEVKAVEIPLDVLEGLADLRNQLKAENIVASDRRYAASLQVIRAAAWYGGRDVAELADLRPLQHVLWSRPEEQVTVMQKCMELVSAIEREATLLMEGIIEVESQLAQLKTRQNPDGGLSSDGAAAGLELTRKVRRADQELKALMERDAQSKRPSEVVKELRTRIPAVSKELLSLFSINKSMLDGQ